MRTLRVAQTPPLDVHRRFSHVLKMNSQIRASSFARFRRVVGLSRVFHHGCFPRICVFCACVCVIYQEGESVQKERKEEKKKGPDLLGFKTLNVCFPPRFSFQNFAQTNKKRERKRTERREVHEEDKEEG